MTEPDKADFIEMRLPYTFAHYLTGRVFDSIDYATESLPLEPA